MKKRELPLAVHGAKPKNLHQDLSVKALERWQPSALQGGESEADTGALNILYPIGENWWEPDKEITAAKVEKYLAAQGGADITVNINSPGGDMFEGVAIYNQLRAYSGRVTVKVLAVAASAASIIAMAADDLQMGDGTFLMIHNSWVMAAGNRHDLKATAEWLEPFDDSMAGIYAARSGMSKAEIAVLMDNESWINAEKAVELGLADSQTAMPPLQAEDSHHIAAKAIDVLLAKAGVPRSERRGLMKDLKGTPSAAQSTTPSAGDNAFAAAIEAAILNIKVN